MKALQPFVLCMPFGFSRADARFLQFVLHEFALSIYTFSFWPSKVVWTPEGRAVGPSIIFASCHMTCPSELSLECVDVDVFEFSSLAGVGEEKDNTSTHTHPQDSVDIIRCSDTD